MVHSDKKIIEYAILLIAGILFTHALMFTKSILIPFVFSVFLYSAFAPFCKKLEIKFKVPHWFSIILGGALMILTLLIIMLALGYSLNSFAEDAHKYKIQIINLVGSLKDVALKFGLQLNPEKINSELRSLPILEWVKSITGGFFSLIGNLFLIAIFTLFMLIGGTEASDKSSVMEEIQAKVSDYVNTKFLVSSATAFLVAIVLWVFGVELAFLFALLTFLLNFIPNVGSIIAILLPLPVLLLQFGLGVSFWSVFILITAIQLIIGNLIEPKLMGDSMNLHPIAILLFLMFWGVVWGIPGMFLAVPISAILRIIFSRIDMTKPLARLMAAK